VSPGRVTSVTLIPGSVHDTRSDLAYCCGMSMDNDSAAEAIGAYFGTSVFTDEPTWVGVLLDQVTDVYSSTEEMRGALDLMNLSSAS